MSRSILLRLIAAAAVLVGLVTALPASSSATPAYDPAAVWDQSRTPYLGWSSWSMQNTKRDGVNPEGRYSWLTEEHVLQQADYMAAHLKQYGYRYIAIDAGWWRTWDWTPEYDQYGRPAVDPTRFPDGMAYVVNYIHHLGLDVGTYMPAGLEIGKEGDNPSGQDLSKPIEGAPQCTLADAIYPDRRTTNGWNSAYTFDFDNGTGCAQAYIDSIVDLFRSWGGVELLKVDGAGPGSGHTNISGSYSRYDNRPEMEAYDRAFQATHRHVEIQVSSRMDIDYAADWQKYTDSWRTGNNDVECSCNDLTTWSRVSVRLSDALKWAQYAGPTTGWSNLDSLEIGSGALDGLTETQRQTAMSIWSMAASPLYLGDDLTQLDDYGISLATNRDVLAVDQDRLGAQLVQVAKSGSAYVVARRLNNGDVAVALFNLGSTPVTIGTDVDTVAAAVGGHAGNRDGYGVTDLWTHDRSSTTGAISADVPAYGTTLLRVAGIATD